MLVISSKLSIRDDEIEFSAIRAQGAGGQHVNKVSSAIHLRFDIHASSLSDEYKAALLNIRDKRINKDGVIVIKAQQFRVQEKNKADALERLKQLIEPITRIQKVRRATKPSRNAKRRRLDGKNHRGNLKSLRAKPQV